VTPDPLADVLRKAEEARCASRPIKDTRLETWPDVLARAAREYFINQIEDEIEDIDRCGDEGMPPARAGLTRAIGIINRGRND